MSDSNPVDEIAASAIADVYGDGVRFNDLVPDAQNKLRCYARAVIAALEREGFKLMRREPTAEMMLVAYKTIHLALASTPMTPMDEYAVAFRIMVDAAPSYATPVETPDSKKPASAQPRGLKSTDGEEG